MIYNHNSRSLVYYMQLHNNIFNNICNCKVTIRRNKIRTFKLIEGKNGPITFLCSNANKGGQMKYNRYKENRYLTEDQAKHVYKKVELGA